MQFSESWLRSFVNPAISTEELAHRLTMSGLEVESVRPVAPPLQKVVVGHVLEVAKKPDADRLNVCKVDAGTGETLQIVCRAPNVRPGIKVPCALVGAVLPPAEEGGKPFEIKVDKLRGVESRGMLCSARELKLSEDHGGLLILADDAKVGEDIRSVLQLDDHVFEIKLTPNKADCLSVHGVARELAALTGAPLKTPEFKPAPVSLDETLAVKVEAPDLCGRFSGRVLRGVNASAVTPEWMVRRLERSGKRSISALVDISNYVMLELGRPTHVFDLDKVKGALEVRWARAGESLKLLNGNTIELSTDTGVIAAGGEVESMAGIMGGDATAVSLDTVNVYLEAAFWWPQSIQGRARRYNFSTDAAHRFERGVDYATTVEHIEYITGLILNVCGGKAGPVDDQKVNLPVRKPVSMRLARAQKIIGVPVSQDEVEGIFTSLGLKHSVTGSSADAVFTVEPPSYRFDIEIEEDLIEEVARIWGFERIPAKPPVAPNAMMPTDERRRGLHALRHEIAARGYQEVVNFGFVDAALETDLAGNTDPIRLLNPIASQLAVMRSSLFGSLIGNLRYNLSRKATRVRVFELGRVFRRDASVPDGELSVAGFDQPVLLGAMAFGPAYPEQWGGPSRAVDFFDVKGDLEALLAPLGEGRVVFEKAAHPELHPGRGARILIDGKAVGWIGELHPRGQQQYELPQAPILFEIDARALREVGLPEPEEVAKFQAVSRDLAVVAPQEMPVQTLLDAMLEAGRQAGKQASIDGLVRSIVLFDVFRPKTEGAGLAAGEKSLAFRITMQDTHSTLQDDTVESAIAQLIEAAKRSGARMR
ncbi:MAG: phenylalanine--tRNA ligase subunit beta [Candidatus Protistobacter heckmanni]|nr:phenylalanine--tRNA ligase subunit beta [Candidatus Protistobacter heckmanni]